MAASPAGLSSAGLARIVVPDFRGLQALNAWLRGHDLGLLLEGPDPDSPQPLLDGIVVRQTPLPGAIRNRWDVVTVWVRGAPGPGGVREPRRPYPPVRSGRAVEIEQHNDADTMVPLRDRPVGPIGPIGPIESTR